MPRPSLDVRRARPEDVESLVTLWGAAREELVRNGRTFAASSVDWLRSRLLEMIEAPDSPVLIAWWDARPAGYALLRIAPVSPLVDGPSVNIDYLFVVCELRRHGIARALLSAVTCVAERHGAESVISNVAPMARETHRFFARLGFAPLVVRRAVSTSLLRRRLCQSSRHPALDDVLYRRRSARARRISLLGAVDGHSGGAEDLWDEFTPLAGLPADRPTGRPFVPPTAPVEVGHYQDDPGAEGPQAEIG